MILTCNSCEKKFVVPDSAIGASGRLVQCSSCGYKWKQFPVKEEIKIDNKISTISKKPEKIKNNQKNKINVKKKKSGPNLYSPEYLAKKHGINLEKTNILEKRKSQNSKEIINFGFYNYLIFYIIIIIFLSRTLFFFKDIIILNFPISEFYLNYFFETIRNVFEITKNLITNY